MARDPLLSFFFFFADSPQTLHGFFDADWDGNLDDRNSIGTFIIFLGANPISWSSIKQRTIA